MDWNREKTELLFSEYKANLDECALWEDKIFAAADKNMLIAVLRERSHVLRDVFARNNEIISCMMQALNSLNDETAAAFSDCIQGMGADRYDDAALLYTLLNKLIPYYEQKHDRDNCILLYNRRAWEATAMLRMGGDVKDFPAVERYNDILRYTNEYSNIAEHDVRAKFIIAYYNIIVVMPTIGVLSVEESYRYYMDMLAFWVSEPVQRLDSDSAKIRGLVHRSRTAWLAVENQIEKQSDDMKRRFADIAMRAYSDDLEQAKAEDRAVNADIFLAYTHARLLKKELTRLEAIDSVLSYYRERKKSLDAERSEHEFEIDDEFYLNTRIPDALLFQWLNSDDLPDELRMKYRRELIDEKMAYLATIPTNIYSPFINESFANWGFGSFRYLNSRREKEDYLFKLVVQRQIITYMHSLMVQRLSDSIQEVIWQKHPEYFIGVLGYESLNGVISHCDEITEFIHRSSAFHDIGKNHIADVINMQHRKLFDCEFQIIKQHPQIGAQLLEQDEDFIQYRDIILGHHKFYNGKGGYPVDFDNTASRDHFIIDLITICDCIDAATDTFGRNYATAKDFYAVRNEIIADAGTRYNPLIADILLDDVLAKKLSELTKSGREAVYFEVYSKYLQK